MSQPNADLTAMYQHAITLHRQGQRAQAEACYQRILAVEPEHFDTLHLLGILHFQNASYPLAEQLIERAIALRPRQASPYANLAIVLQAMQRPAEALRQLTHAVQLSPGDPEILLVRGNLLRDMSRPGEALADYDEALRLRPAYPDALNHRGNVLRQLGQPDQALASYDQALLCRAKAPDVLSNRGDALQDLGRYEEAVSSYDLALSLKPDFPAAWNNRSNALRNLQCYDAALASLTRALEIDPDFVDALNNCGNLLRHFQRHVEAMTSYDRAIVLRPQFAEAHSNRGNALREMNRLDEARDAYQRAVALAPDALTHYRSLASVTHLTHDHPCYRALEQFALRIGELGEQDAIALHFALGDALTQLGAPDRAFSHFIEGNKLRRHRIRYDEAATLAQFEWLRDTITPDFMSTRRGDGNLSDSPVFVVGMPRSGSTLIEQVLASHPEVYGAGEYGAFSATLGEFLRRNRVGRWDRAIIAALTPADFGALGAGYQRKIQLLKGVEQSHRKIVDKSLFNFVHLGLIHLALPNARFIYARRSPVDTCLSIFSKLLEDVPFSCDLGELGRYHAAGTQLMNHWQAVLPEGVLLEVQYEEMVDDLPNQVSRILGHCGLEWNPACLAFHRTRRPVATASSTQVRQPLYTTAVRRWRPAPELLAPLLQGLGSLDGRLGR